MNTKRVVLLVITYLQLIVLELIMQTNIYSELPIQLPVLSDDWSEYLHGFHNQSTSKSLNEVIYNKTSISHDIVSSFKQLQWENSRLFSDFLFWYASSIQLRYKSNTTWRCNTQQCFSCTGTFVLWENLRLPQQRGRCLDLEFSGLKDHPCWTKFPKAIGHCFLNYMFRQPEIDRSATQNEANWSMMWIPLKLWN